MWADIPPSITTPAALVLGMLATLAVSWLNRRKSRVELEQKADLQKAERQQQEDAQHSKLTIQKMQNELDELKRVAGEQVRLDAIAAIKHQAQMLTEMARRQEEISQVVNETHVNTNASKTAMEKIEQELRAELKAVTLAASNATLAAVTMAQTAKDLHARELALRDSTIADLQRQIAALSLRILPPADLAVLVHSTDTVVDTVKDVVAAVAPGMTETPALHP